MKWVPGVSAVDEMAPLTAFLELTFCKMLVHQNRLRIPRQPGARRYEQEGPSEFAILDMQLGYSCRRQLRLGILARGSSAHRGRYPCFSQLPSTGLRHQSLQTNRGSTGPAWQGHIYLYQGSSLLIPAQTLASCATRNGCKEMCCYDGAKAEPHLAHRACPPDSF
eukprot:647285-Pelagomonas_calceolata.AAC.2